jgi:NADH:ubiquinone oxidoreductase subunit 3 (subunit A)
VVAVEKTGRSESPTYAGLMTLLVVLLVVWLVLAILGFVIKGLVWLAIIGIILFIATAIWGWIRRASLRA